MDGDRQKCLDAGCNDCTTKPINRQLLLDVAERYGKPSVNPIAISCVAVAGIATSEAPFQPCLERDRNFEQMVPKLLL